MREAVSHSLHSHIYAGRPPFISPRQKHKDAICYARNPFLCTIRGWNRILQRSCHPEFIKADVCYMQFLPTVWLKINGWRRQWAAILVNWSWTSKTQTVRHFTFEATLHYYFYKPFLSKSATLIQKLVFIWGKKQFKRFINSMLIHADKPWGYVVVYEINCFLSLSVVPENWKIKMEVFDTSNKCFEYVL